MYFLLIWFKYLNLIVETKLVKIAQNQPVDCFVSRFCVLEFFLFGIEVLICSRQASLTWIHKAALIGLTFYDLNLTGSQ